MISLHISEQQLAALAAAVASEIERARAGHASLSEWLEDTIRSQAPDQVVASRRRLVLAAQAELKQLRGLFQQLTCRSIPARSGTPHHRGPALDAREWTAIDAFAVRTRSVLTASRVAAHLRTTNRRSRQSGIFDGIEWMCLAVFEERTKASQVAREGQP